MNPMQIDKSGRLSLPMDALRSIRSRSVQLTSFSENHLLFEVEGLSEGIQLVGQLGDLSAVDLLSFFNMFRKSGLLQFNFVTGKKTLYFKNGEIVFATSTFPEDEIGEILYSLGMLDRDLLLTTRLRAQNKSSLTKILIDQGLISSQDLWAALRNQIESIVYSLFSFHEGSFSFIQKALDEGRTVSLSMNTQNLIMEGLRRIDERAFYMQKIRSFDGIPSATGKIPNDLDSTSQKMLALIQQGVDDVKELLRRSGVGEFDALRLLSQLIERGVVSVEEEPTVAVEGVLGEVVTIFNGVLIALYRVVSAKNPNFGKEICHFLADLPQPFSYVFRQVKLKEDGSVDGGRILANLSGLEEGDKLRLLTEALSELIYMECIAAKRDLGTADSTELIKRVQTVSQRVRNLMKQES